MKYEIKRKILIILFSVIIILLFLGFSYAFFNIIMVDNSDAQKINMETSNLSLKYTDCASDDLDACSEITASLQPGDSITKYFEVKNTGNLSLTYSILFKEILNTFVDDELVFELENLTNGKNIVAKTPLPYYPEITYNHEIYSSERIEPGLTYKYKLTITFIDKDINNVNNIDAKFSLKIGVDPHNVSPAYATLSLLELADNLNEGTPSFNKIATTDEGLFAAEDNYGTSYYFRGATENNYVYFAGFYWRIIRINGDGSLRIIYDGTTAHENGEANDDRIVGESAFNTANDDNTYIGYMYGSHDSTLYEETHTNIANSTIKDSLDDWYITNIVDKGYSDAVSDTLFCNDRSLYSGYGTGTNITKYSAYNRLLTNKNPTLKCAQKNDIFTVNDVSNGNGDLTYPIGLITADEISFAGGKYLDASGTSNNPKYYLYKGVGYWSTTPYKYESRAYTYQMTSDGSLRAYRSYYENGIVPVINLKPSIAQNLSGNGKINNPYRILNTESEKTLAALNLNVNSGTPDFNTVATTDEGLFAAEDDYGTSYYFRGAVENNYVKFAGFYWRIIRINGDGSLRIIYDGKKAYANGESSSGRYMSSGIFNPSADDNAYVGYMYGLADTTTDANRCLILENTTVTDKVSTYTTEEACTSAGGKWTETAYEATHANVKDSTIKEKIDAWYKTNIVDKGYSEAISDTLFCNDRSLSSGEGTGTSVSYYNVKDRLYTNKNPNLRCAQQNDAFTVNDTVHGNGDLIYPIGLMTADEAVFAGGKSGTTNSNFYLYKGNSFLLAAPYGFYEDTARVYGVSGTISDGRTGFLGPAYVNELYALVPVINLTSEYSRDLKGTGTATDPYTVS